MAFGTKAKKDHVDRERDVTEDSIIGEYPGFIPQSYVRPVKPTMDGLNDPSQVKNNVDRGTEPHGLFIDSDVHPQDAPELDHERDSSAKNEILPEEDEDCPIPVRVIETPARRRITTEVSQYSVTSLATDRPFRVLSQDRHRTRTRVSIITAGLTALTVPGVAPNEETPAAYAYSLVGSNVAPFFETTTTEELWIVPPITPTNYVISVFIERELDIDLPTKK